MFSDEERAKILHRLGYPSFRDTGLARGYGHPSAGPGHDQVFGVFDRLTPQGEVAVRKALGELDCIDQELSSLRRKAAITGTADVKFDVPGARKLLLADLRRWTQTLAEALGAPINPLSNLGGGPRVVNT